MLTPCYLIGFTGHRSGFDEAVLRPTLWNILMDLQKKAAAIGGRAELYTSIAEGADTLCVEIAHELQMPVHLLLPLQKEDFSKDFSSSETWERSSRQISLVRQRPGRGSLQIVSESEGRPDCYFNQAAQMLDAVDVLIAVWDGQPAKGLGGTGQVVEQAEAVGLPVIRISPLTGEVDHLGEHDAIFVPDNHINEINELASPNGKDLTQDSAAHPDAFQNLLDQAAMEEAGKFRPSLVMIIMLHGVAALLAAVVTFHSKHGWFYEFRWVLTATELVMVLVALWMGIRMHRRHTQEKWIRCRFACELVRGLRASVPVLSPLHPAVAHHDPAWRRFAVSAGLLVMEKQSHDDPLKFRDAYLTTRLSETSEEGQIRHYLKMQPSATRWWEITGMIGAWSATLAPVFVFLSLVSKFGEKVSPDQVGKFKEFFLWWCVVTLLPIALPLLAGIANSIRHALDSGRRRIRYPEMARQLNEIKRWLPGMKTQSTIRIAIARSEEILLDELIEWQAAMKNTGH